ncbi:hypothetical protein CgunFtcFv8_000007 [Champsocephalus gunnari]|uniref:Zinc finger protein 276 n=1 Tax=Champsocephalus gunnari TaxID=52237 RepID=A0AAN8DL59_CHAGU|nr:hypothetical protein CgunFtcFv8_000007 [Champsocephalus gunnari]
MKKSRRPRPSQSSGTQTSVTEEKKPSGNRGRPKKTVPVTTDNLYHDDAEKDNMADLDCSVNAAVDTQKPPEGKTRAAGRLSTALCRLCHGNFSLRSLRHAFNRRPRGAVDITDDEPTSLLLFHTDFQRLVGVQLDRDPRLSEFICKKCHSKFYKCHSILIRFLQRVNLPAAGKENLKSWKKCPEASVNHAPITPHSFTSDPQCLHSLVSWAHHHGGACRSCPDLKEVLEGRGWGSVQAAWGCVDGHRYIMDTQRTPAAQPFSMNSCSGRANGEGGVSWEEEEEEGRSGNVRTASGSVSTLAQHSPAAVLSQSPADWTCNPEDFTGHDEALSPAVAQLEDRAPDSDLSDRVISEDDFEESRRGRLSDDEFEPDKRVSVPNKRRRSPKAQEEPKVRKKPGPKPGWKNKLKPKAEELPNIYKCPYQGCTAVYRAPDGLKKHIKEHHEEMKERPCPHPGCNKVFMIDRYLQRHVKLIHTEERNYICDQCGQTFKQRKHLSVHQMRHSGAKPLQCEVCGFQCRQRASLKYHMTKHKAEADLDFACLMCGKRFEKAHNLNVHMSMVHPLIQAKVQRGGSEQPPYSELHALALSGEGGQQEQDR